MSYEGGGGVNTIKGYLLRVLASAIICAIVNRMTVGKGTHAVMVKLIAGLFLSFTVISPVAKTDLGIPDRFILDYTSSGQQAAEEGKQITKEAIAAGIKSRTQTYILDKAAALGVALKVEVTLSDDDIPCPKSVRLSGKVSPYAKSRLQSIIAQDLGIKKECQIWT